MESREASKARGTREFLSSNVLNYLVWRYLQEAGFAMAATWLGREWHQDPDNSMPFQKYIKSNQLVHMVQDALFMDDVRTRGIRENHHYYFGDDHGPRCPAPVYDIAGERKPDDIPRARSAETNGINGTSEDITARRKRRKERHSGRRVNGDIMDVDENGYGHSEHASEIDSPAPAVQEVAPLLDTLTIGDSKIVATEKPVELWSTSTRLPWPTQSAISEAGWSPLHPDALLVGGSHRLRLFGIKSDVDEEPQSFDIDVAPNDFEVGRLCWTGTSSAAVAVTENLESEDSTAEVGKLIHIPQWGQEEVQTFASMTGIVFALRWNPDSGYLLSLSGGSASTLSIYKLTGDTFTLHCAKDLRVTTLFDAVWMNETQFIACGTNILQIFEIIDSTITIKQTQEMRNSWFLIKYDPVCDIAAFVDENMTALRQYNVGTEDTKTQAFTNTKITDFEFQPITNRSEYKPGTRRLLATSTEDGIIQLWDILQPFTCIHRLQVYGAQGGCLKRIAFSPDGSLLAGAGFDTVAIWRPGDGGQIKAIWRCSTEEIWRSRPEEDDGKDWVHSLKWDKLGQKLVFTLDDQAVIIRAP